MYVWIPDCQSSWLDELHRTGDSSVLQGEAEGSRRLTGRGGLSLEITKLHALPCSRAECQAHQAVDPWAALARLCTCVCRDLGLPGVPVAGQTSWAPPTTETRDELFFLIFLSCSTDHQTPCPKWLFTRSCCELLHTLAKLGKAILMHCGPTVWTSAGIFPYMFCGNFCYVQIYSSPSRKSKHSKTLPLKEYCFLLSESNGKTLFYFAAVCLNLRICLAI